MHRPGPIKSTFTMLAAALTALACGSAPPVAPHAQPPTARLEVRNPTSDSYAITVAGAPRGTVAPSGTLILDDLRPGEAVVLASNAAVHLTQRHVVQLDGSRPVRLELRPQVARLKVVNHRDVPVEVLVDGLSVGWAKPGAETVLEGVPAGQRTLVARAGDGPRAVRAERFMAEDGETVWAPAVPESVASRTGVPRPPAGQGLIWMKNRSSFDVSVFIGGEEVSLVAAGASAEIIVPPGTHTLVVHIEGADAVSQHEVTLLPNQTAEWDYRG